MIVVMQGINAPGKIKDCRYFLFFSYLAYLLLYNFVGYFIARRRTFEPGESFKKTLQVTMIEQIPIILKPCNIYRD